MSDNSEPSDNFKLDKEHTAYLSTRLPEYLSLRERLDARSSGQRKTKHVKGQKKKWVLDVVFPDFVKKFELLGAEGPVIGLVKKKLSTWFNNNGKVKSVVTQKNSDAPKRPRAKNAKQLYAEEHNLEITALARDAQKSTGEPINNKENLIFYNEALKTSLAGLSPEERLEYEKKAAERNAIIRSKPPASHIFDNQRKLPALLGNAIRPLYGEDWGQVGQVAFFVLAAYRGEDDLVKVSHLSMTPNPAANFRQDFPGDYTETLSKPYATWAAKYLPAKVKNTGVQEKPAPSQMPVVGLRQDGYPALPELDFETISAKTALDLLLQFIEAVWEYTWSPKNPPCAIPWDILHDAKQRQDLLMNWEPFSSFKSLDPSRMGISERFDVLHFLSKTQNKNSTIFEFNMASNYLADEVDDGDISEIVNPQPNRRKKKKKRTYDPILGSDGEPMDFSAPDASCPVNTDSIDSNNERPILQAAPTPPYPISSQHLATDLAPSNSAPGTLLPTNVVQAALKEVENYCLRQEAASESKEAGSDVAPLVTKGRGRPKKSVTSDSAPTIPSTLAAITSPTATSVQVPLNVAPLVGVGPTRASTRIRRDDYINTGLQSIKAGRKRKGPLP